MTIELTLLVVTDKRQFPQVIPELAQHGEVVSDLYLGRLVDDNSVERHESSDARPHQ